jgi:hypothetical protein
VQDRQVEQKAGALSIVRNRQTVVKLPHHAGHDLEAQAGTRLVNVEPFGQPGAMVGDVDAKVSLERGYRDRPVWQRNSKIKLDVAAAG